MNKEEMAVIYREDEDFYIPKDLMKRANARTANGRSLEIDYWLNEGVERRNTTKLAFVCQYSVGKDYFQVYFGFTKASKIKHYDTNKQITYSPVEKFVFCALLVVDPREKDGIKHGRNDFDDSMFEEIAASLDEYCKKQSNLPNIIEKYELNDFTSDILNLCDNRINGKILGSKQRKSN